MTKGSFKLLGRRYVTFLGFFRPPSGSAGPTCPDISGRYYNARFMLSTVVLGAALYGGGTGCGFARRTFAHQEHSQGNRAQSASAVLRLEWQKDLVPRKNFEYFGQEWAAPLHLPNGDIVAATSLGDLIRFGENGEEISRTRLNAGVTTSFIYERIDGSPKYSATANQSHLKNELSDAGRLFFGTSAGLFVGYDLSSNTTIWSYDTKSVLRGKPLVFSDLVIFSTGQNQVIALEKSTGKWRWQYAADPPDRYSVDGFASVVMASKMGRGGNSQPVETPPYIFTGFSDGSVVALDARSGKLIWKADLRGDSEDFYDVDTTPVIRNDRLYVANYATGVYALANDTGEIIWKNDDLLSVSQFVDLGTRGAFREDNGFVALSAKAGVFRVSRGGEVSWVVRSSIGIPATGAAAIDDILLIGGTSSGLHAISQHDGQLLQYFDPRGGIHAAISLSGRHVSVLTNKGRLLSFAVQ